MVLVILAALFLLLIFGPIIWVRLVMFVHGRDRPDFPGTGSELAEHLLREFGVDRVRVTVTRAGDCYDPQTRTVQLQPENYDGRSVTAVAIAAHEVGHALQHHENYPPLMRRQVVVTAGNLIDRIGSAGLFGLSLLGGVALTPRLMIYGAIAVVVMGLARVAAQLVTLPVELDASYQRALPILTQGGYLQGQDLKKARTVLNAAAFTYVAGALAQIINFIRLLRR